MRKAWEVLALFIVVIIIVGVVNDAIQPFLPIIGIIVSAMIVLTVAILLTRLAISRKRFW
jgi:hypothetical protein